MAARQSIRFNDTDVATMQRIDELCEEWHTDTTDVARRCIRTVHMIFEHQKKGGRVVFEDEKGARGIWFV